MPRGDKSSYTSKQKRKAEHIEEGYEKRGVSRGEAARRAWATVNKESGGGKKSGSGTGKKEIAAPPEGRQEGRKSLSLTLEILPLRLGPQSRLDSAAPVGSQGSRKSTSRSRSGGRKSSR